METARKSAALTGALLSLGLVVAASGCSSSTTSSSTATSSAAAKKSVTVVKISATDFTSDFSAMKQLTALASQGKGMVGVLLPDTTTSTRYVQYDAPYLKQAFAAAGLPAAANACFRYGASYWTYRVEVVVSGRSTPTM